MKCYRLLCLCLLFLGFTLPVAGQSAYIFHHLGIDDGLSNNNVKTVLEDSYGFLWIGTMAGLNRYDGYQFKNYSMYSQATGYVDFNDVHSLQEDGLGNIWIGNGFDYIVYCREKDSFITDIPDMLKKYGISVSDGYRIYVDKECCLWVLNQDRIYFYDTSECKLKTIRVNPSLVESCKDLSDNSQYLFLMLSSGELWQLGKKDEALVCMASPWKDKEAYTRVYADSQQGLWVFSEQTDLLYFRENAAEQWQTVFLDSKIETQSHGVRSILDDRKGQIWIGTDHKGIFVYKKNIGTLENVLHDASNHASPASNHVACLYQDKNGIIWMGHNKVGLSYYHDSFCRFINVKYPDCSDITSVLEDQAGNIWLGTDGNGLYIKEKEGNIRKSPMFNSAIISLLEDQKGKMWISSYRNGLYYLENGKLHKYIPDEGELASDKIWGLLEDRYGKIWISSLEALQCLNPATGFVFSLQDISGENIRSLNTYYDGGDKLYVGTLYGLYIIDIVTGKQTYCSGNKQGTQTFGQMYISNVYKSKNNQLYLGHKRGLTIWDLNTDSLYYMTKETGLCDNVIQGIMEDDCQNVWITTSNGVSVLSATREAGKLVYSVKNFSARDGLGNSNFNGYSLCKLKNGDVILGGIDGYILANPNKVTEEMQPLPKVVFTELSVGNHVIQVDSMYDNRKILKKSLELTTSLTLDYTDRFISLEFMAGNLLDTGNVVYAYKLQGFNEQWFYTRENKTFFSSLPPGDYDLLVKACGSDGKWNEEAATLHIKVMPPFYQSVWAYLLYIVLGSVWTVYLFFQVKKRHSKKLEQQRLELEHQQHIRLNEMKLKFFTNISHDLRTPLTLIITPLQVMIHEMPDGAVRKKLSIMYQNAQHLLEQINTLLDFRKLDVGAEILHCRQGDIVHFVRELCVPFYDYAVNRKMHFVFSCEMESCQMLFDADKVQKIVNNLLSNAFKYTPDGGSVKVEMHLRDKVLYIEVTDTGQGISEMSKAHIFERFYQDVQQEEKVGSGIGLHIVNEYVLLHGGNVSVSDNRPCGSVFTVQLPVTIQESVGEAEEADDEESIECQSENTVSETKPLLLLIDDNKDFCDFLADSLQGEYLVKIAGNGREALDVLSECDVDIIVSDVMMPVMNGIELCKQVKTDIRWSHIPIILLTARTAEESQIEGLELGADDYITKPFNLDLLKLRIRKFIEWTKRCHYEFKEKMDVSPSEITITSLDEQLIGKALEIVEAHLTDPNFSVELLSDALGLSRSYLYKKLMFITGKGPAEFIRTIRLKRGKQLLEKSQMQIAEIAYAVGFNSPKRFTQNFKNEFGVLPSEYLQTIKKVQKLE